MRTVLICCLIFILVPVLSYTAGACSVLYYHDARSGKIYVVNNEDYWYDIHPYIRIEPRSEKKSARLWYGWDNFAQGGVNEHGLFFDGAVTPHQLLPEGYTNKARGNFGDEILAECKTVEEALNFLEHRKIALTDAHIFFGDNTGNAVVAEWINGERKLVYIRDNYLAATNFLLADTTRGNYPCHRYKAIIDDIKIMRQSNDNIDLKRIGNVIAKAVQVPAKDKENRLWGTLYSTFIDITAMEFKLVYKLDNNKLYELDLKKEFNLSGRRTIKMK